MTEIVTIPNLPRALHGVVHRPASESGQRVGVIFSINNYHSKFGFHRLFYELAEALAHGGFYAVRYDNQGDGDSPGSTNLSFAHRVSDLRAAAAFFRAYCRLDALIGWGLCMGSTIVLEYAGEDPQGGFDGLILCSLIADRSKVTLPQWEYKKVDPRTVAQIMFFDGNLLKKLLRAPRKLRIYRNNLPKLAARLLRGFRDPELAWLRRAVRRTGNRLARYPRPCVIIFGEKDTHRKCFFESVNPDDRLGLAKKDIPPDWITIKDGDHSFASGEQKLELIGRTLDWLKLFREKYSPSLVTSSLRADGISTSVHQ